MTAELHELPRLTPGIKTRRALHRSSSPAKGRSPLETAPSDGARPASPQSTGAIYSPHRYRGDGPMQMLVIALAIAVCALIVVLWNVWPAK